MIQHIDIDDAKMEEAQLETAWYDHAAERWDDDEENEDDYEEAQLRQHAPKEPESKRRSSLGRLEEQMGVMQLSYRSPRFLARITTAPHS